MALGAKAARGGVTQQAPSAKTAAVGFKAFKWQKTVIGLKIGTRQVFGRNMINTIQSSSKSMLQRRN